MRTLREDGWDEDYVQKAARAIRSEPAPALPPEPSVKALLREAARVLQDCADNMRPVEDHEYIEDAHATAAKLADEDREGQRSVFVEGLKNPANIDLFLKWTGVDTGLDQLSWPKRSEQVEGDEVEPRSQGARRPMALRGVLGLMKMALPTRQ